MNTNYQGDIEAIMEMVLDDNAERAIGALWMLKERMRRDNIEARKPRPFDAAFKELRDEQLPPIIPLRDKKAPIDFTCPTCHAKPGKPCVKMSTRGKGNEPLGTPLVAGKRHAARRRAWNVHRGLA